MDSKQIKSSLKQAKESIKNKDITAAINLCKVGKALSLELVIIESMYISNLFVNLYTINIYLSV